MRNLATVLMGTSLWTLWLALKEFCTRRVYTCGYHSTFGGRNVVIQASRCSYCADEEQLK